MTEIREYKTGDEEKIFVLWHKIFGELLKENDIFDIDKVWWDWRVEKSPEGFPQIMVATNDAGEIIAHHLSEKFTLHSKEKKATIYQGSLSMADEKYRGLPLLQLVNDVAKKMKDDDAIAYGFPNEKSRMLFERFGWKSEGVVPILGRPLNPLFSVFDFKKSSKEYEIKKIERFEENINEFTKTIQDMFLFSMGRNSAMLNWKYTDNPLKKYEKILLLKNGVIDGYAVFRNGKFNEIKTGIILDIFAHDSEGLNTLLNEIISYFKKEKMTFISCYMVNNNFYYSCLKKRGFFKIPEFLLPKKNVVLILNADDRIVNIGNWYISYGDWDCV